MTFRTSSPQWQFGKDRSEGVLYYYAGRLERVVNFPNAAASPSDSLAFFCLVAFGDVLVGDRRSVLQFLLVLTLLLC